MYQKNICIVLFFVLSLFPANRLFAQSPNTGFVSGNIWYSKEPLEEGNKVQIYTFIFNPDSRELSGTVLFFDKTVLLGKKNFFVPPKGAEDVFIDWNVTAGDHTIFGKIENSKFLVSKDVYQEVYLPENETEKSSISVSKKIISTNKNTDIDKKSGLNSNTISDIQKIIGEKTPEFISKPLISVTETIEEVRDKANSTMEIKKTEVKKEIAILENTKSKNEGSGNVLLKPFKQVELFLVSVFSFVLNKPFLFYGVLVVLVFAVLRFIFNLILG